MIRPSPNPRNLRAVHFCAGIFLSMLFLSSNAQADLQDIVFPCTNVDTTYAAKPGESITATDIDTNYGGDVFWDFENLGFSCTGTGPFQCAGLTVNPPPVDTAVTPGTSAGQTKVTGTGGALGAQGSFNLIVKDAADPGNPAKKCKAHYLFHITSTGGGWGDPHLTTVDGVHYDFQSAGEFTALREEKWELQTRQTAVPSSGAPLTNEYTGLTSCVAVYTAAAARIGSSRVTLQPSLNGESDPKGMQLRVDGKLVTLTDSGIDLKAGDESPGVAAGAQGVLNGRIVQLAGGVIEITDTRGVQIVLTPQYWDAQHGWYLNINVYQTPALAGTMGRIAADSWLPALPDGTSLGAKPDSLNQRYQDLYEKFADAWRVSDTTSLFDYAPGQTTATYTFDEWPRDNPQTCGVQGQTPVEPATAAVAAQACSAVTDANQKADCIFDVTVTGHTGFGKSYEFMQGVTPRGNGWQNPFPTNDKPKPMNSHWPWWWIVLLILLILAILLFFRKKSTP